MAGTVVTRRITDSPFYFQQQNAESGYRPVGGQFDHTQFYDNSWAPTFQWTSSYRTGRAFQRAITDFPQKVADEDQRDVGTPDNSADLFLEETNQLKAEATPYDRGHPFSTVKVERNQRSIVDLRSYDGKVYYRGPLALTFEGLPQDGLDGQIPLSGIPHVLPPGAIPDIDLQYGSKAISLTIPTLPVAGAAQFLGELHEGLPRSIGHSILFRERAHAFHGLGDEYLNVQFGWKPFISDVKKFARAFSNAGKILAQYRRDSGKIVHRHHRFRTIRSNVNLPVYKIGFFPGLIEPSNFLRIPSSNSAYGRFSGFEINSMIDGHLVPSISGNIVSKERYWFSGAYTYLLSEDDSFFGRMEGYVQKANKLLGIRVTPDVLWELTPWSWLADWEGNIGVNISNFTALGQDNLVLRYGYLMRESSWAHYLYTTPIKSFGGWQGSVHSSIKVKKKERVRSTPYGFALNPGDFTDHQWAILGALGMTKSPKSLF